MVHVEETAQDQSHATTNFSTDHMARTVVPTHPGSTSRFDLLKNPDWSALTLQELLSQPVPAFNGVQVPINELGVTFNSHSALLTASEFHLDKIRGYMGIRATVVVRLVVNADKFTSGRLALSYQPSNIYYNERRADFRHVTQLPHVELDLNTDTEVVLKIPHRGPYTHFDITNNQYDTGVFRISEYLPHRGNPYSWTVYISFEDIDLLGPTSTFTVAYESGLEVEEKKDMPVSAKIRALSSAATSMSLVPAISSFMAPLAWVTGVASSVLSAFGYSRPTTTVTPTVYVERNVAKLNQTDGTDYADPLAMTTTATVQVSDQIGLTTDDEMSFAYLTKINSAMFRFATNTTEAVGTKIFTFPLAPFNLKARSDIESAVIMHPMAYIANAFDKYRGSMTMTFEFAKTVFHSGRYLIVFEPINPDGPTIPSTKVNVIADAINCHKDIVDIRKGNTFEFTFPFTSILPYQLSWKPYGFVHVFVLNALVTETASVPTTIDVGVKFKAADDMEFAGPTDPRYSPYLPLDSTVSVDLGGPTPQTLDGVSYQSGLEVGDNVIACKPIGSTKSPTPTTDMAALCIGEKILSMKQLAMRSKMVKANDTGTQSPEHNPFVVDTFYDTEWLTATAGTFPFEQYFDWYSYVGRLFEYVRGGVVLTVTNRNPGQPLLVSINVDPVRESITNPPKSPFREFDLQHLILANQSDRVYIPPYNNSYVRYALPTPVQGTTGIGTLPNVTWAGDQSHVKINFTGLQNGQIAGGYTLWRSAADDTQFGGFKGTPYMILREPWNGLALPALDAKAESFFFPNS